MKILLRLVAVLSAVALAGAAETAPFKFPRSTPEAQGVSSAALLELVDALEKRVNEIHSLVVVRRGHVIAEGWWAPYAAEEPHQMFSLSKSFTSTAVGFAIAEGKLKLDDPVAEFFPDDLPAEPSVNLRAMRVRDLLTMASGHHEADFRGFPYDAQEGAVKKFLALPVAHKPGTYWVYNTPASFMLSAIVQKVTGQTVHEYLRPRLYAPLGIANATWETNRQGISLGGSGLSVRTEDIARFGQFYLQKGRWQGKQLLPAAWIESATARQASNGSAPHSDWEQGYGYQFWRCRGGFFRGDGAHGQYCVVLEQHDTVVAITAGTRDMQRVLDILWEKLVPALQGTTPLPANAAAHAQLRTRLASLTLSPSEGYSTGGGLALQSVGKRFVFEKNAAGIEAITVNALGNGSPGASNDVKLTLKISGAEQSLVSGFGGWKKGELKLAAASEPVAAAGVWRGDTYVMKLVRYRTPFVTNYQLRFTGTELVIDLEQNVGPANQRTLQITGKLAPGT